ncbi:MAG: hypothetical protein J7M19_00095 [Planctomycetes bacterium]|nr:hypothetical protein [Planctomycetota bacterium]
MGKKSAPIITIVGGGSVHWSPTIVNDILLTEALDGAEVRLLDINLEAAERIEAFSKKLAEKYGRKTTFITTDNEERAYSGTEYVIITISTGGFDAMRNDIEIPQEYGILQTVGDTVGPGGWNRALRNIPVFAAMAAAIEKHSNDAVVINYSNPMAILTQTLAENCSLRVTGLCHGIFSAIDLFSVLLEADKSEIQISFGGTNHFFFITDVRVNGKDGYRLLAEKLGDKTLGDYLHETAVSGFELYPDMFVGSAFYHQYGYLPYPGDRHTSEFVSGYLNAGPERLDEYVIKRTSVDSRVEQNDKWIAQVERWTSGEDEFDRDRSRETAASIIETIHAGGDLVDDLNLPNRGQITNLPRGVVVETLGVANMLGFTPCTYGNLPSPIAAMTLPHCVNQQLIMKAAREGDKAAAYQALAGDPLLSHLAPKAKYSLYDKLMKANRPWLLKGLK